MPKSSVLLIFRGALHHAQDCCPLRSPIVDPGVASNQLVALMAMADQALCWGLVGFWF
jgi:hypothetical protein